MPPTSNYRYTSMLFSSCYRLAVYIFYQKLILTFVTLITPTQEHCSSNSSPSFLCLQFSPSLSPLGFPGGTNGERTLLQCRRPKRCGFDPWVRKIPWRKAWQLTPGFLPGESHGERSLVGYSPWGHKVSDTTERLSTAHSSMPLLTS